MDLMLLIYDNDNNNNNIYNVVTNNQIDRHVIFEDKANLCFYHRLWRKSMGCLY